MKLSLLLILSCVFSSCSTFSSVSLMGSDSASKSADLYAQRNKPTYTTDYETRAIAATNKFRVKNGLKPVYPDPRLREAAIHHSEDMFEHGLVTHEGSGFFNKTSVKRVKKMGIEYSYMAENVAGPNLQTGGINHLNHTPEHTVMRFMQSPGHRKNILNPNMRFVGMGYYNGFWTQLFTSPQQAGVFYRN